MHHTYTPSERRLLELEAERAELISVSADDWLSGITRGQRLTAIAETAYALWPRIRVERVQARYGPPRCLGALRGGG